jgi:hypothetical protein
MAGLSGVPQSVGQRGMGDRKSAFPKYVCVDPNAHIVDEEYGYLATSVRTLLK